MSYTIKDLMDDYRGQYEEVEVYRTISDRNKRIHTDYMRAVDDYDTGVEVAEFELMDEEEYNKTVFANCGNLFSDYYDPDDKVLVILLPETDNILYWDDDNGRVYEMDYNNGSGLWYGRSYTLDGDGYYTFERDVRLTTSELKHLRKEYDRIDEKEIIG